MKTKPGVDLNRLNDVVKTALPVIEDVRQAALKAVMAKPLVITSGAEGSPSAGPHKKASLHYPENCPGGKGLALDIRIRDYVWCLIEMLKARLGIGWDIIEEGDHIHIERDPKKKPLDDLTPKA